MTKTDSGPRGRRRLRGILAVTGASLVLLLVVSTSCATDKRFLVESTDADRLAGDELSREMLEQLGGADRFRQLATIRWRFTANPLGVTVLDRTHAWDPQRGLAYVLLDDDPKTEVWVRLSDQTGVVHCDGVEIAGDEAAELVRKGYGLWVNDVYWLASPFKIFDPGVIRERVPGGVRIRFGDIGLTPGDRFIYELDEESHLTGWKLFQQNGVRYSMDFTEPVFVEGVTFFRTKGFVVLHDIRGSTEPDDDLFAPLLTR